MVFFNIDIDIDIDETISLIKNVDMKRVCNSGGN